MYKINEDEFHKILKEEFIAVMGEQCKRIEILQKTKDVPVDIKLDIAKKIIKELKYESMRNIEKRVNCFSRGLKYFNFKYNKPIS